MPSSWLVVGVAAALCFGSACGAADSGTSSGAATRHSAVPRCTDSPRQLLTTERLRELGVTRKGDWVQMERLVVGARDLFVSVNTHSAGRDAGALVRIPLNGDAPSVLERFSGYEQALLLAADHLVFARRDGMSAAAASGEIARISLQDGSSQTLAAVRLPETSLFAPGDLLVSDGERLFFSDQDGTRRVALDGGPIEDVSEHSGALALVADALVIADAREHALFGVARDGSAVATLLAAEQPKIVGPVTACQSDVCWATGAPGPMATGTASILRTRADADPITLSETKALFAVQHLAYDDEHLFVAAAGDILASQLFSVAADGGEVERLGDADGFALDEHCMYVSNQDGVLAVTKGAHF